MARQRKPAQGRRGRVQKKGDQTGRNGRRIEPHFEHGRKRSRPSSKAPSRSGSKRRAGSKKGRKSGRSNLLTRMIRTSAYWSFVVGLWCVIIVGGIFAYYGAQMPNASTWEVPKRPPNVKIISYDGQTIANRGLTGGEALSLSEMSPYIPQAVLAIEDRRFYSHFGVDPIGLARAMMSNLKAGRTVQGGSTLTQQLAKNLFLSRDRTLERKVQEVLLSIWLEHNFTKDQIMEMYLNRVYFGSNAYGVEAASRRYFQKPASEVTLAEAALLAGLLKAPSRLSPARNPNGAEARGQVVLTAMQNAGFITAHEAKTALTEPQTRAKSYWTGSENFAADRVMDELQFLIGDVKEDMIVETSLDLDLQKNAEQVLTRAIGQNRQSLNVNEGAIVSVDASGAIRVLIGGRDYVTSQFDRASGAKRQPGSAFKPFVYATALEQGLSPNSLLNDTPIRIGNWQPENYNDKYLGPVTLHEAMAKSLNTVAAQLVVKTGPDKVIETAHRLGIESKLEKNASISLGTSEVSLLELTSAYVPFMNGGYKATPHLITRISTASGAIIYENRFGRPPAVLSREIAEQMNIMLTEVVRSGTGRRAQIPDWQVAGKTGTSQSFRDALFVGYTANLVTGVWLGNDDASPTNKVTGGSLPADIWRGVMAAAHDGEAVAQLPRVTAPVPQNLDTERLLTHADDRQTDNQTPAFARAILDSLSNLGGVQQPITGSARDRFTEPLAAIPSTGSTSASSMSVPLPANPRGVWPNSETFKNGPQPPGNIGMNKAADAQNSSKSILDVILSQ